VRRKALLALAKAEADVILGAEAVAAERAAEQSAKEYFAKPIEEYTGKTGVAEGGPACRTIRHLEDK
jgi:hypothetical protein